MVLLLSKEAEKFLKRFGFDGIAFGEKLICQIALALVERLDLVLDGVGGLEVVDGDLLVLPKSMRAVGGLVFDGRVPPGVEVDDVVGLGEVEAEAARLEADEEYRRIAFLEILDGGGALAGGLPAVEVFVGDPRIVQSRSDDGQEFNELAEYKNFMAISQDLPQQCHEGIELGAGQIGSSINEAWVVHGEPKLGDSRQHTDMPLVVAFLVCFKVI